MSTTTCTGRRLSAQVRVHACTYMPFACGPQPLPFSGHPVPHFAEYVLMPLPYLLRRLLRTLVSNYKRTETRASDVSSGFFCLSCVAAGGILAPCHWTGSR